MDGAAGILLTGGAPDVPPKRPRFGEPQKFLPVAFVAFTITMLYSVYMTCHLLPMLQVGAWRPSKGSLPDESMRFRGCWEIMLFHYLTAMLLICYVRSILEHPGEIPDNDPQWQYIHAEGRSTPTNMPMGLQEMKRTGLRRHCKWCGRYKPDRTHHCRVCKTCILKMDHHCPWIYNCVGFANYKFFFLLLFYSVSDCHLIVWSMAESVQRVISDPAAPFGVLFFTFFGETLSLFLAVLLTMFFSFHIWLMFKAMTTIEFCEKSLPKKKEKNAGGSRSYDSSVYDLGCCGNLRAVLGPSALLWFFPCSRPQGDGLSFVSEETRLTKDMESGKGIRRRGHQRTPRVVKRAEGAALGEAFGAG